MFVYLSCVRSKKRSFGTRCASTKRKASEGRAFGCSKLSDFYELKTTCSRTIQNAELFLSAGASPLMRERRNKPILRCVGYQFGCSIAQAIERHGASLCGVGYWSLSTLFWRFELSRSRRRDASIISTWILCLPSALRRVFC